MELKDLFGNTSRLTGLEVSNSPCGVESIPYTEILSSLPIVSNSPCGVESALDGIFLYNHYLVSNSPCGVERDVEGED